MSSRQIVSAAALVLFASSLFGQGLQTNATKEDWEEINFEFNSSILSDGYPTLLRLSELLQQHRDYKIQVEGHTDYVGSVAYNEKLAIARANTVRDFLVKYGAGANQIAVSGQGKRSPEVPNTTKEGRFINRRVVMTVTDGSGKVIAAGTAPEVVTTLDDRLKKLEDCCNQILKKLDKLDDILAAIRDLKAENDRLKADVAGLKQGDVVTAKQIAELPRPPTATQIAELTKKDIADAFAADEARRKRFSTLNINLGPTTYGDLTFTGSGRYFAPFKDRHAVQVQGEYMYHGGGGSRIEGRQEGQFDIGLVNRMGNFQAGLFSSFKYVNLNQWDNGATLGQGALTFDYIFGRGRVGAFGTKGLRNSGAVARTTLGPGSFLETYLRVADQFGGSALVGAWGDSYFEGNIGYVKLTGGQDSRPGGMLRFVQPLSQQVAFTVEAGLNETLVTSNDSGRVVFGLQFGSWLRPKEYREVSHPVPVDVPRIRYQVLTRRVGNSAPVADPGPDQLNAAAGTITLDGSGSSDADGDALTYQWTQISGNSVGLTGANAATATFTAAAGQTYRFRLTVKDPGGLVGIANTTVSTQRVEVLITRFTATPDRIARGGNSLLQWDVEGASEVSIAPEIGTVQRAGSRSVTPTATTTYTITARNGAVQQTQTVTVTVTDPATSDPRVVRFDASPTNIISGESTTLSWTTEGATSVGISGVGTGLPTSGSRVVSPTQTTTYTLTATGADGRTVTVPIIVTVGTGTARILQFSLSPSIIEAGQSALLCWNVEGAQTVTINQGVGTVRNADCLTVNPNATTVYTLTAGNQTASVTANATLTVGGVKVLTFTSSPEFSTRAGDPVTLTWTTSGASGVIITGGNLNSGSLSPSGSLVVNPNTNVDYTLTAYGPGGQSVSVVIHVFVR